MLRNINLTFLAFLCVGLTFACNKDNDNDDPSCNPTYDAEIKAIVDNSCATVGCHTTNFAHGDFTSYENMLEHLEHGDIYEYVVTEQTMPPDYALPLSDEDFELLQCWLDNEYPEN